MVLRKPLLTRATALALTLSMAVAALAPALFVSSAQAAGLVTSRKITMSSSAATAANATTTYQVDFNAATTHTGNIKGIVVEFCTESPILMNTTCTKPTNFTVGASPTYTAFSINGVSQGTNWTAASLNSGREFIISYATGAALAATQAVTLQITNVQNPTTVGTFYARIYTYTATAGATGFTLANPDAGATHVDEGGIALSTAAQVLVTGKVQEQITFCVYEGSCGTPADVALGDTNGVLDSGTDGDYENIDAKFSISTNAVSGAAVVLKGTTLTNGGGSITAVGSGQVAPASGTEQFGLCNWQSSGSGYTPAAPFNHASCSSVTNGKHTTTAAIFSFDSSVSNTTGLTLGNKAAGTTSVATIAFMANIATSTKAGIYTTTLTLIATGQY